MDVRRYVQPGAVARGAQGGLDEEADRAFAHGAGHMYDGVLCVRIAQSLEYATYPIQVERGFEHVSDFLKV